MNRPEFDKFAQSYADLHAASIKLSGEESDFFAAYKVCDLRRLCDAMPALGPVRRILDFGSGVGASLAHFERWFPAAELVGADVSSKSLAIAARDHRRARLVAFDGRRLPFADATFDCAFAAGVFHHVDAGQHVALLIELRRVLRAGGLITLFEHNPLNPLTVHAVNNCPFDDDAELVGARTLAARIMMAGFGKARVRYRIFFPHALRALRPLERWLGWLPLGAQYCAFARR